MNVIRSLALDDEGDLVLSERAEDADGGSLDETRRRLGPADDPATLDGVPAELARVAEDLADEWADRVRFGRDCRWQAERDYLASRFPPG